MRVEQLEITGVVHDAAHQVAGLLVVKKAEMHVLQLVVDLCSEIADEMPGRFMGHVAAHETEGNAQKIERDQDQGEIQNLLPAFRCDAAFHDPRHGGQGLGRSQIDRGKGKRR